MARRTDRRGKKPRGKWDRPLLAVRIVAAIAGAFVVLQVSLAGVLRERSPSLTLAWVPADAQARADLAAALAATGSSRPAREAAKNLAVDAVRRDPLNVVALRALAVAEAESARDKNAAAIATQSQRLSRRDVPTQMWLIERALRRGDLGVAMEHFDIAFRSSMAGRESLFPLLGNASSDPRLAQVIRERLRQKPEWGVGLVRHILISSPNPELAAQFAFEFLDPNDQEQRKSLVLFLSRLADLGEYDLAWKVYSDFGLGPIAASQGVVDSGFEAGETVPPFAWSLMEGNNLVSYRQSAGEGKGQVLRLSAHSGVSGEVARQLIKLAPGRYRVRAQVGDVPQDVFDRPRIAIRCANDEEQRELISLRPASGGPEARWIQGNLVIPAKCSFQWLSISIAGDGPPSEIVPWIDKVQIVRAAT